MPQPSDTAGKKKTASLTVNQDLCRRARDEGIDVSQIAEQAIRQALDAHLSAKIRAEVEQDLAAYDAFVEKHGSPAQMLRDYLAERDDAV